MLLETAGLALAKRGGTQAALAAYRKAYPNDWQRRLTKIVAADLEGVPKRRLTAWLRHVANEHLIDTAVVANGPGDVDPTLRTSLRQALEKSRKWRGYDEGRRLALENAILTRLLQDLLGALEPSAAVALADKRQAARMSALSDEVASHVAGLIETQNEDAAAHRDAAFEQHLLALPAPSRDALRALCRREPVGIFSLVVGVTDPSADPRSVISGWRQTPPSFVAASAQVMAALGLLCEQYLVTSDAIHWYREAVAKGMPRRDYWLARAGLLALTEARAAEIEDAEKVALAEVLHAEAAGGAEPIVRVLQAAQAKDHSATLRAVADWSASDPLDRTVALLECVTANLVLDADHERYWDAAIAALRTGLAAGWLPEIGLVLARLLCARVQQGKSLQRAADLAEALDFALRARDDFRLARQPSVVPLVEALSAAGLDMNIRLLLTLGTDWPEYEGQATKDEAANPTIIGLTLPAALDSGEHERLRDRVLALPAGFERAAGLAAIAAAQEDADPLAVRRLWDEALAEAATTQQRLRVWHELALLGDADLIGLRDELGESMPALVTRLQATAASASGFTDAAIAMLLPQRRTEIVAARMLVAAYEALGQSEDAAKTLLDAADDFHTPELALQAAFVLARSGDLKEALNVTHGVMVGSLNPAAQVSLLMLRADLFAQTGDMQHADEMLEQVLARTPDSVSARWGRTRVLLSRGRKVQAWECLSAHPGGRPEPRDEPEARALLEALLHGQTDPSLFVTEGLDQLRRYPDSEGLAASFLLNAMVVRTPLPNAEREQLGVALQAFIARWPDSKALRQVQVPTGDVEEMRRLLDEMSAHQAERAEALEDLARQVAERALPTSVLAWATGRPYLEVLVSRPVGVLISEGPDDEHREAVRDAVASLGHEVVCDLAAIHVAAELSDALPAVAQAFLGSHRAFLTTDDCVRDAVDGCEALARTGPGMWIPGDEERPGYFQESDPSLIELRAEQGVRAKERCLDLQAHTVPPGSSPLGSEVMEDADAWQSVLSLAQTRRAALWSDDLPTRILARQAGTPAFSSRALVAALVDRGLLNSEATEAVDQALLGLRVGDLPFSPPRLRLVAQEEGFECRTAGQAWARAHSWLATEAALPAFADLLREVRDARTEALPDWCFAGVLGATSVHYGLGPAVGQHIASQILAMSLHLTLDRPELVARCVGASRLAVSRSHSAVGDPLPIAVRLLRDALSRLLPGDTIPAYFNGVFAECDDEVLATMRSALLT